MLNTKYLIHNTTYRGFSLLEAVISVFVIATGLTAIIMLMSSGASQSIDSRDQAVAVLLSQEGTEIVRNIRDNNWVNKSESFKNLPNASKNDCIVDGKTVKIESSDCNKNANDAVLRMNTDGRYLINNGSPTKFRRKVDLVYDGSKDNLTVSSMVVWGGSSFPSSVDDCNTASKCTVAEEMLTKWGER